MVEIFLMVSIPYNDFVTQHVQFVTEYMETEAEVCAAAMLALLALLVVQTEFNLQQILIPVTVFTPLCAASYQFQTKICLSFPPETSKSPLAKRAKQTQLAASLCCPTTICERPARRLGNFLLELYTWCSMSTSIMRTVPSWHATAAKLLQPCKVALQLE
mmetsp:Transcript_19481/g.66238  ORF Transcript_19481/g.66238 Transcript_19481/m.66238 type:complete len:160 (-) Transcript_19481:712-1191(-)